MDPSRASDPWDYDLTNELEYGAYALAFLLRGNYPPPYYGTD
jgi:hypothetical protein